MDNLLKAHISLAAPSPLGCVVHRLNGGVKPVPIAPFRQDWQGVACRRRAVWCGIVRIRLLDRAAHIRCPSRPFMQEFAARLRHRRRCRISRIALGLGHLVVTAALIARPCAGVADLADVTGRDRQEEEPRRQDDRQPCAASSLIGESVHCEPLWTDGPFIRGGDSAAVETWGEVPELSYLLLVEVFRSSRNLIACPAAILFHWRASLARHRSLRAECSRVPQAPDDFTNNSYLRIAPHKTPPARAAIMTTRTS